MRNYCLGILKSSIKCKINNATFTIKHKRARMFYRYKVIYSEKRNCDLSRNV